MGYHVELVASPPRPITWDALLRAAAGLGWRVSGPDRDIGLLRGGQPLRRLNFAAGEAWVKSPDEAARVALFRRGDAGGTCRSLTGWNAHPDHMAPQARTPAPRPAATAKPHRRLIRNVVRFALFGFAYTAFLDQR